MTTKHALTIGAAGVGARDAGCAVVTAVGDGQGADLRGGSVVAEAAAEPLGAGHDDRRGRGRPGPRVGRSIRPQTRRRRTSRPRPLKPQRSAPAASGAAGARVRSGRQPRRHLGRPGPGLRVARVEPRHHRRSQGQRLDRRQRRHRHPRAEVHRRRASSCCRSASKGTHNGSNDIENLVAAGEDLRRVRRPTRPTSPTATATAASSCSTPTPASTSATGAPTATSPTTPTLGAYDPEAPPSKQFRTVHCAERLEGRARLRLRPRQQPHPGVPQGRHVREGSVLRQGDAALGLGVGHDVLARSAADATSTWPTA